MSVVVPLVRGGSSSTPPNWPKLASDQHPDSIRAAVASGAYADVAIDTVSLKLPWPLRCVSLQDGRTVGYDADDEVQWESHRRLSLRNVGPSWSASISCRTRNQVLEVSGSPVKFLTGQNLHQPLEDLPWLLARFLPHLQTLIEDHLKRPLGDDWVEECLCSGRVTRIDLNRQFSHGSDVAAKHWLATAVRAKHGVKLGAKIYPYRAFSESSVRAGPKRRWHLAVYMKRPEMSVQGHLPREDIGDALQNEAEGITRHELRTMSEGLSEEQRALRYWTRPNIEAHFAATWENLFEPSVEHVERGRTQRRVRRRKLKAILAYDEAMIAAREKFAARYGVPSDENTVDILAIQAMARELVDQSARRGYVERYEWVETPESDPMSLRPVEMDIVSQYQDGIHVYEKLSRTKSTRTLRRIVNNIRRCVGIDIEVPPQVAGQVLPLRQARPTIWMPTRSFESLSGRLVS